MADEQFESDATPALDAQRLLVEALGEPGQRRFRLMAIIDGDTYIVWMEKQQLQALGLALEQLLEQLPEGGPSVAPTSLPVEFNDHTSHQFRAGRMELGYDERRDRIVVAAHDIQRDDDINPTGRPEFACRLTRSQAREISVEAATVAAAGRPRCPMCGQPMSPSGHVCPQMNGHLPLVIDETDEDDIDGEDPGGI